jgi:hypothetical protein
MPDPTPIHRLIRTTRRLLRSSWVITGLCLTMGLLLGTLAAATFVDLLVPLERILPFLPEATLRLLALLAIVVPATWALAVYVVRPLLRRLGPITIARKIESHIPGIHNRLVSCLDLADQQQAQRVSQAFYRRLFTEALDRVRSFRPSKVIDFLSLRRSGVFAAATTVAFLIVLALFSDRLPTALARILHPFADIPPASGVAYTVTPGDDKVLRGEDIVFTANVEKGDPKKLTLELTDPTGKETLRHNLEPLDGNRWSVTLRQPLPKEFDNGFAYRVRGGGTWSREYHISMVERPTITELATVLHYPQYMDLPSERKEHAQVAEVAGPEGTQDDPSYVEVVVRADGDVQEGEIQILRKEMRKVPVKDRSERVWFDKELPAGAHPEFWNPPAAFGGRTHTHTEPPAVQEHGHWFTGVPAGFQVQPGEYLYAYVYLVPQHLPKTIMLEWHDGRGWEHRAYWGDDLSKRGVKNTSSRHKMSDLPAAGQWVRLEVPAAAVDLDGKALHGMGFQVIGGQAIWQSAGAMPPSHTEEEIEVPDQRFAMSPTWSGLWSGRFPLRGKGTFRVEVRDAFGHPNQQTKQASKFEALPDNPPAIVLEKPGPELLISTPGKVTLAMKAYDDYGLKEIAVLTRRSEKGDWTREVVRSYPKPERDSGDLTTSLNLAAMQMVLGDTLYYRVEAVDRKGQKATWPEQKIRIAAGPNTADQQLAAFEKTQDPFQERLVKLIESQAKVQKAVDQVKAKYAPLMEKVEAAKAEARSRLDPESAKLVDALRAKLNDLAREKARAEELGQPKLPPSQGQPKLDPESAKLVADAQQKLTELAKERAKNAQEGNPPPPAPAVAPKLDAESRRLMDEMTKKLDELSRQREQNAKTGQPPPKPSAEAPKLDAESAKLLEGLQRKLAELEDEKDKAAQKAGQLPKDPLAGKPVQLDPETAKQLEAMQRELDAAAKQQQGNLQEGDKLSKDLARSAEEASKLEMLPKQLADDMKAAAQTFDKQAVEAMRGLLEGMQRAATAKKETPPDGKDVEDLAQRADRIQKELEAMKDRLKALADARKQLRDNMDALAELERELQRQNSSLTARDLEELRDFLKQLREELEQQKGKQEDLLGKTEKSDDKDLDELEFRQNQMDKELARLLGKTKDLQASEKIKRMKKKLDRDRPKAPYTPEGDDETGRPKEEDSNEPLPKKGDPSDLTKTDPGKGTEKKMDDDEDDDEKKFLPQLGGQKKKIDPRYAKKQRPGKRPQGPSEERDDLEARQNQNLRDLDSAEKSVEADQDALDKMLQQLQNAMQGSKEASGKQGQGQQQEADDAARQLGQMMQTPGMKQAQAMAARAQQMRGQRGQAQAAQVTQNPGSPNLSGANPGRRVTEADLSKLDLPTRAMILRMKPKEREELLQKMIDKGPEGYDKHIEEYYKRLSQIKNAKP